MLTVYESPVAGVRGFTVLILLPGLWLSSSDLKPLEYPSQSYDQVLPPNTCWPTRAKARKRERKRHQCEEASIVAGIGSLATAQEASCSSEARVGSSPLKCFRRKDFKLSARKTQARFYTNQFTPHVKFEGKRTGEMMSALIWAGRTHTCPSSLLLL